MNTPVKTIDAYLVLQSQEAREMLSLMRHIIHMAVPDAEEVISYSMPAFRYRGKILVYFAAFKKHCSLFAASGAILNEMENELKPYRSSKGTLQFPLDKPLPIGIIKKIVKERAKENKALEIIKNEKLKSKKIKTKAKGK